MKLFLATALAVLFALPVAAWTVEDINEHIENTNFIVANHCSGTLISVEHRLILTNNHCVEMFIKNVQRDKVKPNGEIVKVMVQEKSNVVVSQRRYDGHKPVSEASYVTEIVDRDIDRDLALLQFRQDKIPMTIAAKLFKGDKVYRGETVYVIGNPMMLDAAITRGIISSTNRLISINGVETAYYQVDAGIVGGNSGGALYNDSGELIGVPAAGARGTSVGLAIPFGDVQEFLTELCFGSVWNELAKRPIECKVDRATEGVDGE